MTVASRAARANSASTRSVLAYSLYTSHAPGMAMTSPPTATSHPVEYCADRESDDLASKTVYRRKSRPNLIDNCARGLNPDQANTDGDGVGDLCEYADLSVDANHSCALRSDGAVSCWRDNTFGQTKSANQCLACGVTANGKMNCQNLVQTGYIAPPGKFSEVSVGEGKSCGMRFQLSP